MRCLVCLSDATDPHHWPEQVGMGRSRKKVNLPEVPLCRTCHDKYHDGCQSVCDELIRQAPAYWRSRGEWEWARPYLERFVARREYLGAMRG